MDRPSSEAVGYFIYEGLGVKEGIIDARAGGLALLGIDECIRYFAERENPILQKYSYELPVQTKKGSWEVLLIGAVSIFGAAYLKKSAEKMAENDFKDIGLKDVLKKSAQAVVYLIKLIKHKKGELDLNREKFSWDMNRKVAIIKNDSGDELEVPAEYIKWYASLPQNALKNIAYGVRDDITLTIGAQTDEHVYLTTEIRENEKIFFGYPDEENPAEFLFPEFRDGDGVMIRGRLTRGNEQTNSVGVEHQGHVLNCIPEAGNINRYKPLLFTNCLIKGTVTRFPRGGAKPERKPTIIISSIEQTDQDISQNNLFE